MGLTSRSAPQIIMNFCFSGISEIIQKKGDNLSSEVVSFFAYVSIFYLALTTILRPLTIYMPAGSDRVVGMFADK